MCGKFKRDEQVSSQPSRRALIFGGFKHNWRTEDRCNKCEHKLVKIISSMIRQINSKAKAVTV
jgi:hypothetical protein